MPASPTEPSHLRFAVFELDLTTSELRKSGVLIHLPPQPFKILGLLASRPGQLVTREEIQQKVWGSDTFVDFEHGLNFAVKKIREALGDDAEAPRYIETLPRRGYRFIASVDVGAHGGAPPVASVLPSADAVAAIYDRRYSRRHLALAGAGLVAVVAALLAFNVVGLRDRIMTAAGAGSARPREGGALPYPIIESIAVLPLENLSGDPEQEYFSDGMTDELIAELGQISSLRVISRTSAMRYKSNKKPLAEIAEELNVQAVVEGSVLRAGSGVRITVNLIDAKSDRQLWAHSYEAELRDVLTLQSEVARAISNEIQIKLTPQEQARLASARPVNPESYRLYIQGRYHLNQETPAGVYKSISLFQQALEKDPHNALAWAGLSESDSAVAFSYDLPKDWFVKAKAAALKALEIDDSLAEAHAALGIVHMSWDWDWPAAERERKHAIELKPSDAWARYWYAAYLSRMGRHEQAIAEIRRAQELDPLSPRILSTGADIYRDARRYDEAIEQSRKALELDPNYAEAHGDLGLTYILKGMWKEAATEIETADRLSGSRHTPDIDALIFAAAGRRGEGRKLIPRVKERAKRGEMTPFAVAQFYVGLGDKQTALDWLEKAYDQRDPYMATLKVNPIFDPLRSDPRFEALLRRMNFPP